LMTIMLRIWSVDKSLMFMEELVLPLGLGSQWRNADSWCRYQPASLRFRRQVPQLAEFAEVWALHRRVIARTGKDFRRCNHCVLR
jgi:hypothetical protein